MMRVLNNGSIAAEIPAKPLADEAPLYSREARKQPRITRHEDLLRISAAIRENRQPNPRSRACCCATRRLLRRTGSTGSTTTWFAPARSLGRDRMRRSFICGKRTSFSPPRPTAIRSTAALDPREGGRIAVAEAARNLTCSGAVPLRPSPITSTSAIPTSRKISGRCAKRSKDVAEACRAFATPVIGGNVSLYNESPAGVVDPTPTVAMVGLIEREEWITTQFFKAEGDLVILLGDFGDEMGGSHFLESNPRPQSSVARRGSIWRGRLRRQNALRDLIRGGWVRSAHDCSEGGPGGGAGGELFQSRWFVRRKDRSPGGRQTAARSDPLQRNSIANLSFLPCRRTS